MSVENCMEPQFQDISVDSSYIQISDKQFGIGATGNSTSVGNVIVMISKTPSAYSLVLTGQGGVINLNNFVSGLPIPSSTTNFNIDSSMNPFISSSIASFNRETEIIIGSLGSIETSTYEKLLSLSKEKVSSIFRLLSDLEEYNTARQNMRLVFSEDREDKSYFFDVVLDTYPDDQWDSFLEKFYGLAKSNGLDLGHFGILRLDKI
ncbi:MAG: hypothetical protein M1424_07410 [Candidatus Thermoplasmatota archaeon]|nr:hypothetical protein [Candidatus Thermoplasmatota archaeon]